MDNFHKIIKKKAEILYRILQMPITISQKFFATMTVFIVLI